MRVAAVRLVRPASFQLTAGDTYRAEMGEDGYVTVTFSGRIRLPAEFVEEIRDKGRGWGEPSEESINEMIHAEATRTFLAQGGLWSDHLRQARRIIEERMHG